MCLWIQDAFPSTPLKKKPGACREEASSSKLSPVKSQIRPRRVRESRPASFGEVKAPEKMLRPAKRPLVQPKAEGDEAAHTGEAMQIVESKGEKPKDDLEIETESEDKAGMCFDPIQYVILVSGFIL